MLKSPFVHKKAQENFEKKYHGRVIKLWDADRGVVDKWLRYLKKYSIGGVGMKAVVHDWTSLDATASSTTSANTDATSSSVATVSDQVLKAVGDFTADLKGEVASAAETVKAAATTVKDAAEEAVHTVETLTGLDTLRPEEKTEGKPASGKAEKETTGTEGKK